MSCIRADLSDEALWALCRDSEAAQEQLVRRYTRMVRMMSRPFFLAGADSEDLVQEGMIGLLTAIRQYEPGREASFSSFAGLCIRRRMISAVRSAASQKHQLLTNAVSMQELPQQSNRPGPEELLLRQEQTGELEEILRDSLSRLEQRVLGYYLDGWSYSQIADALDKSTKTVDNAVQRIRAKATRLKTANTGVARSQ